MNKLFSKIATLSVGLAMAVGVGVALGQRGVQKAEATDYSTNLTANNNAAAWTNSGATHFDVTLSNDGGQTAPKFNGSTDIRLYNKNYITISAKSAFASSLTISSLVINGKGSHNDNTQTINYKSDGTLVKSGASTVSFPKKTEKTYTLNFDNVSSVNLYQSGSNNVQLAYITISYSVSSTDYVGSLTVTPNSISPVYNTSVLKLSDFTISGSKNGVADSVTADDYDFLGIGTLSGDVFTARAGSASLSQFTPSTTENCLRWKAKYPSELNGSTFLTADVTFTVLEDGVSSLTITGSMTKTAYGEYDVWSPAGLTVTANYTSGNTVDVTSSVAWSYNPAKPAVGVTSVVCTATYQEKQASTSAQAVTVSAFSGYVRTNSLADLTVGDSYVVGSASTFGLMGSIPETKKFRESIDGTDVVLSSHNGVATPLPEGTVIITLLNGGDSKFVMYDITNSCYLVGSSTGSDFFDADSFDDASLWEISFDENGMSVGLSGSTRVFGYNTSAPRFTSYASYNNTTDRPVFFKLAGSSVKTAVNTFCTTSLKMDQYDGDNTYNEARCTANYSAAKTAYAALSEAEKNVFANATEFASAKERFTKWAVANGETFDPEAGTFETSVLYTPVMNFENNAGYVVIIAVITLSAIAFGVVILTHKRKHQ